MAKNYSKEASEVVAIADNDNFYDGTTTAVKTITYEHHNIHSGDSFAVHFDATTASTDDHISAVGFKTSDTAKWVHLIMRGSASSPAEAFLLEAPTISDGAGSEVTIYNRNRNSNTASTVISLAGTPAANFITTYNNSQYGNASVSGGTVLDHVYFVGGEGPKAVGGGRRADEEWVLKQATKYVLYIQNVGANDNLHEIHLDWYEHTDSN